MGKSGKRGSDIVFFFIPFVVRKKKKKTFTLMSFCSFESKGYPIYNAWALTAKLEASFWQFGNFCLIVKVDLSAWQIIISDHSWKSYHCSFKKKKYCHLILLILCWEHWSHRSPSDLLGACPCWGTNEQPEIAKGKYPNVQTWTYILEHSSLPLTLGGER